MNESMPLSHGIIWVLFIGAMIFIGFFFMKRIKANKIARAEAMEKYEAKKLKYMYLKPGFLMIAHVKMLPQLLYFIVCVKKMKILNIS